jgi:5-methylcytosine-specific restriction enzyme A
MAQPITHRQVMHSARWLRLRLLKLRTTPCCERCAAIGELTAAIVVHHVKAVSDGGDPYPVLDGLQSLCKPCHDTITNFEQRGATPRIKGCDERGWPLDPDHAWNVRASRKPLGESHFSIPLQRSKTST